MRGFSASLRVLEMDLTTWQPTLLVERNAVALRARCPQRRQSNLAIVCQFNEADSHRHLNTQETKWGFPKCQMDQFSLQEARGQTSDGGIAKGRLKCHAIMIPRGKV